MKTFFFLWILFSGWTASAQTLVISDVDDTLKISNVLNLRDTTENAVLLQNHFLGMAEVFQRIEPQNPVRFFYVTNAIDQIMHVLHQSFLDVHDFPEGTLLLRPSLLQTDFKLKTITALIRRERPQKVILFGDNGEKDPQVYAQIATLFPELEIETFIHQVYSNASDVRRGSGLYPGQIGYATSVDLATYLVRLDLMKADAYQQFITDIVPRYLSEREDRMSGEVAIPAWMDCRDVVLPSFDPNNNLLERYSQKVHERCSRPSLR